MFRFIKELYLDGVREIAFQNEKVFVFQKAPFIRVFDIREYDLISEKALKGMTGPSLINNSYLVARDESAKTICVYKIDSLEKLREKPVDRISFRYITSENDLLVYDAQSKKTSRLNLADFEAAWSEKMERTGRSNYFYREKLYTTQFLNDQKLFCVDWLTGRVDWEFVVNDHFDQKLKIDKIVGVFDRYLIISLRYYQEGKVILVDLESGGVVSVLLSRPAPIFFDEKKCLLFNIGHDKYWEFNLRTKEIKNINLWEKYDERYEFSGIHSSFNQDYIFAFSSLRKGGDNMERSYSVIERKSLDILWKHVCTEYPDDGVTRTTANPVYYKKRLYFLWEDRLSVYEHL